MKKLSMTMAAILVSTCASAEWAVYDVQVVKGVQSIVDGLRNTSQGSAAIQSKVAEQVANAVTDASATGAKRRAERDYQIQDACGAIAGTRGLSAAARINDPQASIRRRIGAPPGASNKIVASINIANGQTAAPPVEVQSALAVTGACDTFVDPASGRGQACLSSGQKSTRVALQVEQDADIKATTLFRGAAAPNEAPRTKLTISTDETRPEFFSLAALRRNFFRPIQLRELSSGELQTAPGRQYTILKDSYDARESMAAHPFDSFVQDRAENKATIGAVDQLLNSPVTVTYTQNYLDVNGLKDWRTRGISRDELMNLEVERRYMNLDWHKNLAQQPGDPVQKEMAVMMAEDQYMKLRAINGLTRSGVLLGQIAGTLNRLEMTPQLNALHAAAASANR